jgi:hypothetical protein
MDPTEILVKDQIKKFIVDNAKIVTKDEVITGIRRMIGEYFLHWPADELIYINLISNKIGSEHWIYLRIRDLLPNHKVLTSANFEELQNAHVFYFDDWCLSGNNACSVLENLLYDKRQSIEGLTYHILTYVGTEGARHEFEHLKKACYKNITIEFLYCEKAFLFSEKLVEKNVIWPIDVMHKFHAEYNPDTESESYLIYSDYKIPNGFGSYPLLYETSVNREFMNDVKEEIKQFL